MRRAWLRGRDNVRKRYLIHVAGYNLGLIMRLLVGAGTPREFLAGGCAYWLLVVRPANGITGFLIIVTADQAAMLVINLEPQPHG